MLEGPRKLSEVPLHPCQSAAASYPSATPVKILESVSEVLVAATPDADASSSFHEGWQPALAFAVRPTCVRHSPISLVTESGRPCCASNARGRLPIPPGPQLFPARPGSRHHNERLTCIVLSVRPMAVSKSKRTGTLQLSQCLGNTSSGKGTIYRPFLVVVTNELILSAKRGRSRTNLEPSTIHSMFL